MLQFPGHVTAPPVIRALDQRLKSAVALQREMVGGVSWGWGQLWFYHLGVMRAWEPGCKPSHGGQAKAWVQIYPCLWGGREYVIDLKLYSEIPREPVPLEGRQYQQEEGQFLLACWWVVQRSQAGLPSNCFMSKHENNTEITKFCVWVRWKESHLWWYMCESLKVRPRRYWERQSKVTNVKGLCFLIVTSRFTQVIILSVLPVSWLSSTQVKVLQWKALGDGVFSWALEMKAFSAEKGGEVLCSGPVMKIPISGRSQVNACQEHLTKK